MFPDLLHVSSGGHAEEIRKGRILAGLRNIWRVLLEILPLHNSEEKRWKKLRKHKKNQQTTKKYLSYAHMLIVVAFLVVNVFSFLVIAPSHQLQSGRK